MQTEEKARIPLLERRFTRRAGMKGAVIATVGVAGMSLVGCGGDDIDTDKNSTIVSESPVNVSQSVTNTPEASTVIPAPEKKIYPNSLRELGAMNGILIGTTIESFQGNKDPRYNQSLDRDFSLLRPIANILSPSNEDNYSFSLAKEYSRFAQDHGQAFDLGHVFDTLNAPSFLSDASADVVRGWMEQRVDKLFSGIPYFTHVNFANEAFQINKNSNPIWANCPFYKVFGEDWLRVAYVMVHKKITEMGKVVGKDVCLRYNDSLNETPSSPKAKFIVDKIRKLKQDAASELKIGEALVNLGLEFHVRTVPLGEVKWWGPHADDLDPDVLLQHFKDLGEQIGGDLDITEFSIRGSQDRSDTVPILQQREIFRHVLIPAIDSKKVKTFNFWAEVKPPYMLFDQNFEPTPFHAVIVDELKAKTYPQADNSPAVAVGK